MTWARFYPIAPLLFLSSFTIGTPIVADVQHLPPSIETETVARGANINCNGISDNKYFTGKTIENKLNSIDGYCPLWKAAIGGSDITRYYFLDTMEEVQISISRPDATTLLPSEDDCKKRLKEILDECATEPPMKWNPGGNQVVNGWTYNITAQVDRQPAPKEARVKCEMQGNKAQVSGAGWLNSDFGNELKVQAQRVGWDSKVKWGEDFRYELKDGYEWTFSFRDVDDAAKDIIEQILGVTYGMAPNSRKGAVARIDCNTPEEKESGQK